MRCRLPRSGDARTAARPRRSAVDVDVPGPLTGLTFRQYAAWYFLGRKPPLRGLVAAGRGFGVAPAPLRAGYERRRGPEGPGAASHEEAGYSMRV